MKAQLSIALGQRIDEIKKSYNMQDLREKYQFACGFLFACHKMIKDSAWSDMWSIALEETYIYKKNSFENMGLILEDTPF